MLVLFGAEASGVERPLKVGLAGRLDLRRAQEGADCGRDGTKVSAVSGYSAEGGARAPCSGLLRIGFEVATILSMTMLVP